MQKGRKHVFSTLTKKHFYFIFQFQRFFSFSTSQKEQLFHAFVSRLFLRVGVRWRARVRAGPVVLKKKGEKGLSAGSGNAAPSRCGPVWRATNPAVDATAVV